MNNIIVALIGAGGSIAGAAIGMLVNIKLVTYRLSKLEEKVNQHNNLIDRTYKLEANEKVLEEQMKVANHRISDLEEQKYQDNKFVKEV